MSTSDFGPPLKPSELATALACCVRAKRPVIAWGSPGIGKSQIAQQLAQKMNRRLFDVRAALLDAVDLRGIPSVINGLTHWCPPAFLPQLEHGPSILLLDELNRAPTMVQNALLQLILDRKLGEYRLPDECEIISCCNRESDGGGVQKMPQALANRFLHLPMEPDLEDWCAWAVTADVEPTVISFLRFRPQLLHKFSQTEKAFPSPRSWEFVSNINANNPGNGIELALYTGAVGAGAAGEYYTFLKLYRTLPSIDSILANPTTEKVPREPGTLFAVAAAVARRATADNIERVLQYLTRLPKEYCVYSIKDAVRRDEKLTKTPSFGKWARDNASFVF